MFISKVNRLCERHGRAALIIIGLVMVVPFVFFWGPGGSLIGGGREGRMVLGQMYGRNLTLHEFRDHYRAVQLQFFLRAGRFPDETPQVREYLVEQTLRRIRLLHQARQEGLLVVASDEVHDRMREMFSRDGRFDADFYRMFVANLLPQLGLTEAQFEESMRENIALDRVQEQVVSGVFVAPAEVRREITRQYTAYAVQKAVFDETDFLQDATLEPSDEEVEQYFEKQDDGILMPPKKRVRAAVIPLEDHMDEAEVAEDDIAAYYERNKAVYERRETTLDEVRSEIADTLREQAARRAVLELGSRLVDRLTDAYEAADDDPDAADTLAAIADDMGIRIVDSGPFTENMPIPNLGRLPRLQEAAYALEAHNPFSRLIYEPGRKTYYLAAWLETLAPESADELTPDVRRVVRQRLENQRIDQWFDHNVAPFADYVELGIDLDQIIELHQDTALDGGIVPEAIAQLTPPEFRSHVQQTVRRFYEPARKRVRVVRFDADDFTDMVADISDADVRQYYQANLEEYAPQVRTRHILLRVQPDADDEQRNEVRQQLEDIRQRIVDGADFAEMARQYSEDPGSAQDGGLMPYMTHDQLVGPFADAAFALDVGDVSDVVETRFGYHAIKLVSRVPGQDLEEAAEEIRRELRVERAGDSAWEAANTFAYQAYDAVAEDAGMPPAEAFAQFAERQGLTWQDTGPFTAQSRVPELGSEVAAAREAYRVTQDHPVSEEISATNQYFVVCWLDETAARLPSLDAAPQNRQIVRGILRRAEARSIARRRADEAHVQLSERLRQEAAFEEASEGYEFSAVPEFTQRTPPWAVRNARLISEAVAGRMPGTLLEPLHTEQGAMLLFLEDRIEPAEDDVVEHYGDIRQQLRMQKQGAVLEAFHQRLARESNTQIPEDVRRQLR